MKPQAAVDAPENLPLNVIDVHDRPFLQVETKPFTRLHLASLAGDPGRRMGRAAVRWPGRGARDSAVLRDYDGALALVPMWATRTICGIKWRRMAHHAREIDLVVEGDSPSTNGHLCPACSQGSSRGH